MDRGRQGAPPVGRDDELARIDEFLTLDGVGAAALVVEGEAGIGKTTLWSVGVARARDSGFRVLVARPAEAERELSFATLGDLLADVHEQLRGLPPPQRRSLARALLIEETQGAPVEPRAVGVAVLATLRLLASEQPLLVAIDDVQWVDPSSALALSFALRRALDEPVHILLAQRTGQGIESRIQLDSRLSIERVVAGPLSLGALRRLLEDRLGASFPRPILRRICDTAGGNPFFVLELARALQVRGEHLALDEELPMPADISRLLARRLDALPAGLTEPLAAVAALAEPTLELVGENVIEPALEAGVLVLDGDRLRFEHPLVATAAYARLTPARRRALHSRLADIVQGSEERVRHLALAVDPPDDEVARALEDAAERAFERGATQSAAELIEHALRFSSPDASDELHRRRLTAIGYLARTGAKARARELFEQARGAAPDGPARAELALTGTWFGVLEGPAGIEALRVAIDDAGSDRVLLAKIHNTLVGPLINTLDIRAAEHHAGIALELAEEVGDDGQLAFALIGVAQTAFVAGRRIDVQLLERAAALEAVAGNLYGHVSVAHFVLGAVLATAGELERARRIFEDEVAEERRRGDIRIAGLLSHLAGVEIAAGNWDRARALAEESLEVAREADDVLVQGFACRRLVALAALRGDAEQARALGDEALQLTEVAYSPHGVPEIQAHLGLLELSLDDADAAASHFDDVARFVAESGFRDPGTLSFVPDHVESLIATGDLERAEAATAAFGSQAERLGLANMRAGSARCRGLLAGARGDLASAVRILAEASAAAAELGQPFELARTLLAQGETLRRFKKKKAAREALESAKTIFDELGAKLWSAKAARELARISGRTRASGLTETEQRVAELVAAGRSNKEIAGELFVTVRTVETHLTKVYAKLAVRSRTELVSRLSA